MLGADGLAEGSLAGDTLAAGFAAGIAAASVEAEMMEDHSLHFAASSAVVAVEAGMMEEHIRSLVAYPAQKDCSTVYSFVVAGPDSQNQHCFVHAGSRDSESRHSMKNQAQIPEAQNDSHGTLTEHVSAEGKTAEDSPSCCRCRMMHCRCCVRMKDLRWIHLKAHHCYNIRVRSRRWRHCWSQAEDWLICI